MLVCAVIYSSSDLSQAHVTSRVEIAPWEDAKVVRTIKVTGRNSLIEVKGSKLLKKSCTTITLKVPISFSLLSKLSLMVFSNSGLRRDSEVVQLS